MHGSHREHCTAVPQIAGGQIDIKNNIDQPYGGTDIFTQQLSGIGCKRQPRVFSVQISVSCEQAYTARTANKDREPCIPACCHAQINDQRRSQFKQQGDAEKLDQPDFNRSHFLDLRLVNTPGRNSPAYPYV
ncbi:hypothetical protein D3C73_1034200 [compost metagenome]